MYAVHPLRQLTKSPNLKSFQGKLCMYSYPSTAVATYIVLIKGVSFISGYVLICTHNITNYSILI